MGKFGSILVLLGLICSCVESKRFNIMQFGAVQDTTTDNSQAFVKAWNALCTAKTKQATLVVPFGKILLNPIVFSGPCLPSKINIKIYGEILAPSSPRSWSGLDASKWVTFSGVTGLSITGSGGFDGQGKGWWDQSCRDHTGLMSCTSLAPTALSFLSCNDTTIRGVHLVNSPQSHVLIFGSSGMNIDNVFINSPADSPNTDGIHIQAAHKISIRNSIIGSGDDCVSIGDYTSDIKISDVKCGPGHGISIGSLGRDGNEVQVENIHVNNVTFTNTTNGARIKTWQVGRGFVRDISYVNCKFNSVQYPIIIDQNYCSQRDSCKEMNTGVKISDVTFDNFSGTSRTDVAINLNCSRAVACSGITLSSIKLTSATSGKEVTSFCTNAQGNAIGKVEPQSCLY